MLRGERDLELSFTFSFVVLTHASSLVSSSQLCIWVWDHFLEFIPTWGPQLSAVLTSLWLVFNCCLYIIVFTHQLTFFLFFILWPLPQQPFNLSSLQLIRTCSWFTALYISISNPGIHWYTSLDFPICFTFTKMLLSFPQSYGGPVNLTKNNSQSTRVFSYFIKLHIYIVLLECTRCSMKYIGKSELLCHFCWHFFHKGRKEEIKTIHLAAQYL